MLCIDQRPIMATLPRLETVLIERVSPAVALLYYNQPHISNAFTVQQYRDTNTALIWTLNEPSIKVVVVWVSHLHVLPLLLTLGCYAARGRESIIVRENP